MKGANRSVMCVPIAAASGGSADAGCCYDPF
jgi:hypothetical protein